MSASIHRLSCERAGVCQGRQPACELCSSTASADNANLGGGNFWLHCHRVTPWPGSPDEPAPAPLAGPDDDDETDEGLGLIIVRALGWLVFAGCALFGAGVLTGMAWQHIARWLA